jgi:N-acetylneuraminate synthase
MTSRVFIIAEAGVNHNGDVNLALELVDIAANVGADAVKFQTFRASLVATANAPAASYQRTTAGATTQLEVLQRLELSIADYEALAAHARSRSIEFLSTPFDLPSLKLLTEGLGITTIKIPSGEITNAPFLLAVSRAASAVIMSTGMSTMEEIGAALGVLAFGFSAPAHMPPDEHAFATALRNAEGRSALERRVTLLHCTSEYPAPYDQVNLRAMDSMREAFGLPVGYSDHTPGIHVAVAATARHASVIEKHFTTDRALPGPDHAASVEPGELADMIRQIRDIEAALGDGRKAPTPAEHGNLAVARKSLVALSKIRRGEPFTADNVGAKRPGTGSSPFRYWSLLGQLATRNYDRDELLDE